MNLENLLNNLKSTDSLENFLDELLNTLYHNDNPTFTINELIAASSNLDDVLLLFNREKLPKPHALKLFKIFGIILFTLSETGENEELCLHITRWMLQNHRKLFAGCFHDKYYGVSEALYFLTAMLMSNPEASSEISNYIDLSRVEFGLLAKMGHEETKKKNKKRIRKKFDENTRWNLFIFTLAVLKSDNNYFLAKFLEFEGFVSCLFENIIHDPPEFIIKLLILLKENVVLNLAISKTTKVKVFHGIQAKYLLNLYFEPTESSNSTKLGDFSYEEREEISRAVHELWLILVSNHKYGIVFKGNKRNVEGMSSNVHFFRTVKYLKSPWKHERGRELISSFLTACPDISKDYEEILTPFMLTRGKGHKTTSMNKQKLDIDLYNSFCMVKFFSSMVQKKNICKEIENNYKNNIYEFKNHLVGIPFVTPKYITYLFEIALPLKHVVVILIQTYLKKGVEAIDNLNNMKCLNIKKINELKNKILNELQDLIPFVKLVNDFKPQNLTEYDQSWKKWYAQEYPSKLMYLTDLIKFYAIYAEVFGFKAVSSRMQITSTLKRLQRLPVELQNDDDFHYQDLISSVLKLILKAQDCGDFMAFGFSKNAESEDQTLQNEFLSTAINVYLSNLRKLGKTENCASNYLKKENFLIVNASLSGLLLTNCLEKWGLSLYSYHYFNLWLNNIGLENQSELCGFVCKIINKSISNSFNYLNEVLNLARQDGKECVDNLIQEINSLPDNKLIEDNTDVIGCSDELKIPFSIIFMAAVELLKESSNSCFIEYFSKVASEYVDYVSEPNIFIDYLLDLEEPVVLNDRTYLYFRTLKKQTVEPMNIKSFSLNESLTLRKIDEIFIANSCPKSSQFFKELLPDIRTTSDLIDISRRILLYVKLEIKSSDKKKLKFFIRIFRNLINISDFKVHYEHLNEIDLSQFYEYLINDDFLLTIYQPFLNEIFHCEINLIIETVAKNHPTLRSSLKKYYEKLISLLKTTQISDLEFDDPISVYLNFCTSFLTFADLELLLEHTMNWFEDASSLTKSYENLLLEILSTVAKYCSKNRKISENVAKLFLEKTLLSRYLSKTVQSLNVSEHSKDVASALDNVLISALKSINTEDISTDYVKALAKSTPFKTSVCAEITTIHHPFSFVICEVLEEKSVPLLDQAPYISFLIKAGLTVNKYVQHYLMEVKSRLKDYLCCMESTANVDYKILIEHMIESQLWERHEVLSKCSVLYESVVEKRDGIPQHILSFVPFFVHLRNKSASQEIQEKADGELENPEIEPGLQLLEICLICVTQIYEKSVSRIDERIGQPCVEEDAKKNNNCTILEHDLLLILDTLENFNGDVIKGRFSSKKIWLKFVKKILKLGLNDVRWGPKLLKCLWNLSGKIYSHSIVKLEEPQILTPETLFNMLKSHSQFLFIMLNNSECSSLKEELVMLYLTLIECESTLCQEGDLPLIFGSYNATRSTTDQILLKIIKLYEKHEQMSHYEPVLWGEAAVTHFNVEEGPKVNGEIEDEDLDSPEDKSLKIKGIKPTQKQILTIIDYEKVLETALNFDMNISLEPEIVREMENQHLYDQRFLLPLFYYITRTDNKVRPLLNKGVIPLAIAALSSHKDEVWSLGAAILKKVTEMLVDLKNLHSKLLWVWLLAVASYGLKGKKTRVPSIIVHFLIKATDAILNPHEKCCKEIMRFLYLRPSLDLNSIPEFYILFWSYHHQNHIEQRAFILSLLSSGIRDESDLKLCRNSHLSKLILSIISAPSTTSELRILALNVLASMTNLRSGTENLVYSCSLLVTLPHALETSVFCDISHCRYWIEALLPIFENIWKNLTMCKSGNSTIKKESTIENKTIKRKSSITDNKSHKKFKIDNNNVKTVKIEIEDDSKFVANSIKDEITKISEIEYNKFGTKILKHTIYEFFSSLGFVISKIFSFGTEESISRFLSLLNRVIIFLQSNPFLESRSCHENEILFLKKQIKSWLKPSILNQRFGQFSFKISQKCDESSKESSCKPFSSLNKGENTIEDTWKSIPLLNLIGSKSETSSHDAKVLEENFNQVLSWIQS